MRWPDHPLADLRDPWGLARRMVELLFAAVGGPATIATLEQLTPHLRRLILCILHSIESFTRQAILIEAMARVVDFRPLPEPTTHAPVLRPIRPLDDDEPRFRVTYGLAPIGGLGDPGGERERPDLTDPEPLARRFEAAIEALRDPEPLIAKVAGRLSLGPPVSREDRWIPDADWLEPLLVAEAEDAIAEAEALFLSG